VCEIAQAGKTQDPRFKTGLETGNLKLDKRLKTKEIQNLGSASLVRNDLIRAEKEWKMTGEIDPRHDRV
jgi:hypothetical protein